MRTVSALDLRGSRTAMEESKRNVRLTASARKPSMRFSVGSPVAMLPSPRFDAAATSPSRGGDLGASAPAFASAATAIPYALGTPSEAAAALKFFQSMEGDRDALAARNAVLEEALTKTVAMFAEHVAAVEATVGPVSQYYTVTFGPGHIGMILTADDAGNIEVAELRDDDSGRPLLAKASGKIICGDHVLAVNNRMLHRFGTPTPEAVASEFRSSPRPMTVLFKRNPDARLRLSAAAGGDA